ncbi:MAG: RNA 2',3'-cyclic phosphodiesterase [Candidatus Woesearchaeota archaeon]
MKLQGNIMRTFIAIELPKEIREYLTEIQKQIGSENAKIKWVAKKHLHLTLKFLGEISEKRIELLKELLGKIKFKRFEVNLSSLGVFPNEKKINVIWIDLKPAGKIIELQQKIDSELLNNFPKEQRFYAHLTLGRVKFVKNKEALLEKIKNVKIEPKEFEINEFKLIKSDLTKDGPVYTVLVTYSS